MLKFVRFLPLFESLCIGHISTITLGPISTWTDDRLWAGKPSRYVTSHLGQLSLPSLRGR